MNDTENGDPLRLLRQQTTLARFGELALRSDDLDEILTEACHLVGEALGTDLAKVMELQADGETLRVRSGVGWKPGVVGVVTLKATYDSSEGRALKTGEPMISPDISKEKRFKYPPFLIDNGVKAVANVVIIGGHGRPAFGILQIDSRKPRRFTDEDTDFLRSYANLIAGAVDRHRMIGELREGAARLRESMNRQEAALETGLIGFFEWDTCAGMVIADRRFAGFYGLDPAEAELGVKLTTVFASIHPDDLPEAEKNIEAALSSASDFISEHRLVRPDGELTWVRVHASRYKQEPGARFRYTGTAVDVTATKLIEEALRRTNDLLEVKVIERTRELTEANALLQAEAEERGRVEEELRQSHKMEAVGQLTGGLAHDFNNLLAGISGSLELVQTRMAQGRTADVGRYIEAAMASASRAAALTHRLLAFSRRQTLDPKPTDMNRLVGGMQELFGRTVGPGIQVETRLAADLWLTLCDPNQLENALLNLVINARDAMPGGGRLSIETANRVFPERPDTRKDGARGGQPAGEHVALVITDTGTGMAPDVIARAFDPFFTTKLIGQGTGLGLSMIYGFVQQSGGHVMLRSEIGQGTTVTIYLPRHLGLADGETVSGDIVKLLPPAAGAVVLLVEDEPAVRMILLDVLSDCGYLVLEAGNGRAGLNVVESTARIDLLITDVGLPGGMNGHQMVDAARQVRPGLKVLFITGYAQGAAGGNGRMEPGTEVMIKPFAVEALTAKVQAMIDG